MQRLVIVGGGIVGITIAIEIAKKNLFKEILLIEKEKSLGSHATVRNSGVIHAGFYYTESSKKAEFCSKANNLLRNYCVENNITINKCGKVVVTKNEKEEETLELLYKRGVNNGVKLEIIDKKFIFDYDEYAKSYRNFLWSPNTWSASPKELLNKLISESESLGIKVLTNTRISDGTNEEIIDNKNNKIKYDFLINAAGGYALELSKKLGIGSDYSLLPFKGLYLKSKKISKIFKRHIYPVPNINQPFLGIHTTLTSDNFLKLGPTAIPVLSPENYKIFDGLDFGISTQIIKSQIDCFFNNNFGYRDLAFREIKYLLKSNIIKEANKLTNFDLNQIEFDWYTPGIRAQLYDFKNKTLEMDFKMIEKDKQLHILNSISPAWTCSFMTARYISDKVITFFN